MPVARLDADRRNRGHAPASPTSSLATSSCRCCAMKREKLADDLGAHAFAQQAAASRATTRRSSAPAAADRAAIRPDSRRSGSSALAGLPRDLAQQPARRVGGREAHVDADLADIGGALRPVRSARHLLDVVRGRETAAAGCASAPSSWAAIRRRSPTTLSSGIRLGLWTALSRLWIRLVMKTVLPERLSPVTASQTVERLRQAR